MSTLQKNVPYIILPQITIHVCPFNKKLNYDWEINDSIIYIQRECKRVEYLQVFVCGFRFHLSLYSTIALPDIFRRDGSEGDRENTMAWWVRESEAWPVGVNE